MAITYNRYLVTNLPTTDISDIAYSITDGSTTKGGEYTLKSLGYTTYWAWEASGLTSVVPNDSTIPPLPNIYPILFSSDVVYGREHFSQNLKMFRGDTYSRKFMVIQDGTYYDLTGCSIRMTFKWSLTDSDNDAVFTLTSPSSGIEITDAAIGEFQFTISPSHTTSLPPFRVDLFFDAQVTDASSNVYTIAYGQLGVLPDSSVTAP